ncbi:MAG: PIN domain-containing protein [Thermomicrobiales bacterium]|nr:PIN domain-containing protein [Thermomicrobiales bacterium]
MIVLDTSGIVALANRADPNHADAVAALKSRPESLVVPSVILAEAAYVLTRRAGEPAFVRFLDAILAGQMLWHDGERELRRVRELILRYANLPLGFADAAVIAAAETSRSHVLTFDRRHFEIVAREGTIQLLP